MPSRLYAFSAARNADGSPFKGQPQVPYKCPVYTDVTPLGSLTGEMDRLPLGPFMLEL